MMGRRGRGIVALAALAVMAPALLVAMAPAHAQKSSARIDGVYDFSTTPHTGSLALKGIKGGVLFDLSTVSPKGTTCAASGKALGGTVLTFRDATTLAGDGEVAGFRMKIERDQITISGLLGRVSDAPFCGLGAMLTGVYKRRGPLDAKTTASLVALEKGPDKASAPPSAPGRTGPRPK